MAHAEGVGVGGTRRIEKQGLDTLSVWSSEKDSFVIQIRIDLGRVQINHRPAVLRCILREAR
jgi:hypothetical protein